jgi:hypothetical protein
MLISLVGFPDVVFFDLLPYLSLSLTRFMESKFSLWLLKVCFQASFFIVHALLCRGHALNLIQRVKSQVLPEICVS